MSIGIQSTDSVKVIDGPYIMPYSYIHINAIVFGNGYDNYYSIIQETLDLFVVQKLEFQYTIKQTETY